MKPNRYKATEVVDICEGEKKFQKHFHRGIFYLIFLVQYIIILPNNFKGIMVTQMWSILGVTDRTVGIKTWLTKANTELVQGKMRTFFVTLKLASLKLTSGRVHTAAV